MAKLKTKVKLYAKANGVNSIDFLSDVRLQNDIGTDYIKEWNLDIPEPTSDQLASYESAGNTEESNNVIRGNRKAAYPEIGDQLDMLWHSIDENAELKQKYFKFYEAIKAVKAKYTK